METLQSIVDIIGWIESVIFVGGAAIGMFCTLMFGRRYKQRIVALEAQVSRPSIVQVFNYRDSAQDRELELQSAIEAETTRNLQEAIRSLTQRPLEGGHTYAELPHGTNIVSMADGSFRLAIPINIDAHFEGGIKGILSAGVTLVKANTDEDSEGRST